MINHFDQAAISWDSNPVHWERSEAIAQKMMQIIYLHPNMTAMEYGVGTGILSFLLKDYLKEITLMDSSVEMVKVMEEKIRVNKADHLKPLYFDLEKTEYRSQTFDLIFTQMVLHHVTDVEAIITKFYHLLNFGGNIAIADLYPEDGSFHGEGFTGHLGFDVGNLSNILNNIGFKNIKHEQCFVIRRVPETKKIKEFPIFILTGKK
jgi:ubiquinone/menaquinone biosynthesis C-methylase UbiE